MSDSANLARLVADAAARDIPPNLYDRIWAKVHHAVAAAERWIPARYELTTADGTIVSNVERLASGMWLARVGCVGQPTVTVGLFPDHHTAQDAADVYIDDVAPERDRETAEHLYALVADHVGGEDE